MTEKEPTYPTAVITFRGRELSVRMPRPEQLLVWRRTMRQLQAANPEGWTATEVLDALERGRRIVDSLLDQESIAWLDDEMLTGGLGLPEVCTTITKATEAFGQRSEEDEPAKKTPKKAAKKAVRKAV